MTNAEYSKEISAHIEKIQDCIEKTKQIALGVIGESLISADLCFCAFLDRSIRLANGFISMLESRNLTCAGAILRLQMDNCLRLLALNIAEDEEAAVDTILKGGSIGKLKDKNGKVMSDGHLKDEIKKYDTQFPIVYNNTSGFIHFSHKAVFQSIYECKDYEFRFQIGGELNEKYNINLLECAQAFLHYYCLFLRFMEAEAEWKKDFDKSMEDE